MTNAVQENATQHYNDFVEEISKDHRDCCTTPVYGVGKDTWTVLEYLNATASKLYGDAVPHVDYVGKGDNPDNMPEFILTLPRGDAHELHHTLKEVFDGPGAVINRLMPTGKTEFHIVGNPARLVRDIQRNDPVALPKGELGRR